MKIVKAQMAGIVIEIRVKPGDIITEGMEVIILESMKMQIPVPADLSGKISKVHVSKDDFINEGDTILTLE